MNTENKPPYVGPRTFEPEERDRFFGREREARELFARVVSERLVLFYAQSGAGKSSLVNTCLIPDLKAKKFVVFPVGRVGGEALPGTEVQNIFVFNLINRLTKSTVKQDRLAKSSISELITSLSNHAPLDPQRDEEDPETTPHILVIDQFEELFSTHAEAWTKREDFFQQLAQAMDDHPYLRVVLVMREDFIASLDPYAHLLPGRLGRRYYMQRLEREAAIKAVRGPVEKLRPFAPGVAEKLVDDLSSIKVQKPDGTQGVQAGQYVEPVQLQVVCHSLWRNLAPGGTSITDQDLSTVGDVDDALGKYYAERVAGVAEKKNVRERLIRDWIETKLIAPGGIRSMVLRETSGKSDGMRDDVIQELQSDLVRAENRGGAIWYELTHDRLVVPIQENNKKWFDENLSALQRQAALWAEQNEHESWLLTDQALVDVEDWARANPDELGELDNRFLNACRKLQAQIDERNRAHERQLETEKHSTLIARRFTAVAVGFLILAIFTTIFAFSQRNAAEQKTNVAVIAQQIAVTAQAEAKHQADISRAGELSALALGLADSKLDLAILLGIEANSLVSNSQSQNALLTLMQNSGGYLGTLKGTSEILDVQFAPNGETLASLDANGITLWDADTLQPLHEKPLGGHLSGVSSLALSQDGKLMASGGSNGTIVIWDAVTRQMLGEPFKRQDEEITNLALSADGSMLAWSTSENTIMRWDVKRHQPIDPPLKGHTDWITSLAFSPDGKTLASGSYDRTIILWDPTTGDQQATLVGYDDWVTDLAFDGTILASASDDYRIVFWDVSKPSKPEKLGEGSNDTFAFVRSISISPENDIAASGQVDGLITLWDISDINNPAIIGEPFNQEGGIEITGLAFSPEGNILAAQTSEGSNIDLWDVQNQLNPQKMATLLLEDSGAVSSMVFQPEGQILTVSSYDSTITYWDVSNPAAPEQVYEPLQGHPGQPTGMEFSPDGSLLASFGDDRTILFDVESQKLIGQGELSLSATGDIWAYESFDMASGESTIHLKDTATGNPLAPPIVGENPAFSPDGKMLIFQTINRETEPAQLHLWDIATAKDVVDDIAGSYLTFNPTSQTLVYQTQNEESGTTSIVFRDLDTATDIKTIPISSLDSFTVASSDGTVLVLISPDETSGRRILNLLDTATGDPIIQPIEGVDFGILSANGRVLFYSGSDENGNPRSSVLNVKSEEPIGETINGYIQSVNPSKDVTAYSVYDYREGKTTIRLVNTKSAQEIAKLNGTLLNLVQDGDILIYENNGIHLFDTGKGTEIGAAIQRSYLDISPDGRILATRGEDNSVVLWDTRNTWLLGEPVAENTDDILSAALSPDGNVLAFAEADQITLRSMAGNDVHTFSSEHLAGVSYVILSPDKQTMLSIGEEGNTIAWDLNSGESLSEPIPGSSVAFSPDGKLFAVGDGSNTITIVNTATGIQEEIEEAPVGRPAAFSPDGKILAIEGETNTTLFDLTTRQILDEPIQGAILVSQKASDVFVVVDRETNTTTIQDWETMAPLADPIPGSTSYIIGTGISVLVVQDQSSDRPTTSFWNLSTGKQIGETLTGSYDPSLSPDGTLISAADEESSTTYIWNLTTQNLVGSKQGYFRPIFCGDNSTAAFISDEYITLVDKIGRNPVEQVFPGIQLVFSPDCSKAIMIDTSGLVQLWDVVNIQHLADLGVGDEAVFSSDSAKVAVASSETNSTTFWNLDDLEPFGEEVPAGTVYFTPGYPNILQLYDGITDATTLWDINTGTRLGDETYSWSYSPVFSADGKLITYNSKGVALWDTESTRIVSQSLHGHLAPITNLLFSPDGKMLASLANDGIVLTDLDSGSSRRLENEDPASQVTAMAFRDGASLTSLGNDGTILVWDITGDSPTPLDSLDAPYKDVMGNVYLTVLSPDGKYLIYEYDGQLNVWSIDQKRAVQETNIANSPVEALAVSPDGHSLFYADGNKVFQWEGWSNTARSEPVELFSAGQNSVWSLAAVMGDGAPQYLVVSSYSSLDQFGNPLDLSTQIWELTRHSKLGNPLSGYKQAIGPYTRGHLLLYIDNDGRLIESNLDPFYLTGLLCNKAGRNFTYDEWKQYFPPDEIYRRTCGKWPLEPQAIGAQAP